MSAGPLPGQGQSKEMSWASPPPCGGCAGAGAGWGGCCWGAPPAGAICNRGGGFVSGVRLRGAQPAPRAGSTHLLVEGLLPGQVGLLGWQAAQGGFLAWQGGHEALQG